MPRRCRGKCELQVTKIVNEPLQPEVIGAPPVPANFPLDQYPHKADTEASVAALLADIRAWSAPYAVLQCAQIPMTDPAAPPLPCTCRRTGAEPTPAEWAAMPTLTREFRHRFNSKNRAWESKVTVEYKVAYVAGACEEPAGIIYYAGSGTVEGHGLVVASADGQPVDAALLAKIKGALG
jgi:hypothetical protein